MPLTQNASEVGVLINQTIGHTKDNIKAWVQHLKQTIGDRELMHAIARAPEICRALPTDRIELLQLLRHKLFHLGCSTALATKINGPELITVLLAATAMFH